MAYSKTQTRHKTFVGALLPDGLFKEFGRLCKLSGRSKAKETELAISMRVSQLQQQERAGTIGGIR